MTSSLFAGVRAKISSGIGGIVANVIQGIKNLIPFGGFLK